MDFLQPSTWADALAAKSEHPEAVPIAGGTDVMVELNFDRRRPVALVDLTRVPELREWDVDDGQVRLGAGVTYARLIAELADRLPGLAIASRSVGSPQIRNRGTVGGNLATASPAGDAHPPLLASGRGGRGGVGARAGASSPSPSSSPARSAVPLPRTSSSEPCTSGPPPGRSSSPRSAPATPWSSPSASFAVALHPDERRVGTGIGSAAPTPRRAPAAEELASAELDWDGGGPLDGDLARRFGDLVAEAADPIDDVRGTAAYRRHALSVMARRTLSWAWDEYREELTECG